MNPVIKVENLTKKFGSLTAVNSINFEVFQHEIFGLLGPNGAGKTTMINMICGLLPVSEGRFTFPDHDGREFKTLIGYCPQDNIFYPRLTCLEQMLFIGRMYAYPSRALKARAMELLHSLGLLEKTNVLAGKLSGGMKRRLNICLALIHNPEILVLDEPEAGLDPQSRILVRDFIRNYGKQKTIILTTHNMDEADRLADRIAILDHGKLLLLDTPQNLKKTVGEGDVLELVMDNPIDKEIGQFLNRLSDLSMKAKANLETVVINHQNILEQIPVIKNHAEACGLRISQFRLRENTLEDVFIHLTGRNLRP